MPISRPSTSSPAVAGATGRHARGSLLIACAGLSALLAALALMFLARMRSDAEEMDATLRETQARLMLFAACQYVQEASRLGLPDDPATPGREEGFGWIDVRDGHVGPKAREGADDDRAFPIGTARRYPMHRVERPPCAIRLGVGTNPIETDRASPDFGMPYFRNPDPLPVSASFADFRRGDLRPVAASAGRSWFRLRRETASRFLVTCGAGASDGFRDWSEVVAAGETARFADQAVFADLRARETRMWFLIEWSGAARDSVYHDIENDIGPAPDNYLMYPMNASTSNITRTQSHCRDAVGSIRWIQRLRDEPARW